jgi:hypothetical protein
MKSFTIVLFVLMIAAVCGQQHTPKSQVNKQGKERIYNEKRALLKERFLAKSKKSKSENKTAKKECGGRGRRRTGKKISGGYDCDYDSTSAPTSSPTTSAPTSSPTTSAPTSSPTTSAPTSSPTTSAPKTIAPTTSDYDYDDYDDDYDDDYIGDYIGDYDYNVFNVP